MINLAKMDSLFVCLSVAGGSMPFQISPGLIALEGVNWSRVHFFFCDERVVPFDDPESTFGIYQKTLFSKLNPPPIVHKIDPEAESIEKIARLYQDDILNFFGVENGYPAFDLLLLGIGPDGHTCSLFPHHKLLRVFVPLHQAHICFFFLHSNVISSFKGGRFSGCTNRVQPKTTA